MTLLGAFQLSLRPAARRLDLASDLDQVARFTLCSAASALSPPRLAEYHIVHLPHISTLPSRTRTYDAHTRTPSTYLFGRRPLYKQASPLGSCAQRLSRLGMDGTPLSIVYPMPSPSRHDPPTPSIPRPHFKPSTPARRGIVHLLYTPRSPPSEGLFLEFLALCVVLALCLGPLFSMCTIADGSGGGG